MKAGFCLGCKRSALLVYDLCYSCEINDVKSTQDLWKWEEGDLDAGFRQKD